MYPKNDHDHPAPLRYIFEGGGGEVFFIYAEKGLNF